MNGFKTGVMDAALHTRYTPDFMMRTTRQIAAASGADSIWIPDHLNGLFPTSIWKSQYVGASKVAPFANAYYEPWTVLGNIAAHNRFTRLQLGVGVTDAGRRNPAVTAQAAATLHHLSRGRAILGIGPGEREGNEPYGVEWNAPVSRFEEALATIRALWDSGGDPVTRDSPYFPLRNAVFEIPPHRNGRPPMWVAAHGPRMLKLAGKYANAWFPAFAQLPEQYRDKLERIRSAASDFNRDPQSITPAAYFFVLTSRSSNEVDEMVESVGTRSFTLGAPADAWARHGVQHPMGSDFSGAQDLVPHTIDESTALKYSRLVPDGLVRDIYLTGRPSEIIDKMSVWRDHGVRYAVLMNLGGLHPKFRTGFASSLPLMQVLRGLRKL
ncbi:LLM class flavin-dependent oxidoreductase [Rhodococcus sp. KBS0724]|uniref:LLM class flavin-dependent oxidoreductase n=1 Tax=Rhodococcus sp. KBS0724 TaxID=1179674 RepID=UPI00110D8EF8|nr:LLM class flavin-dependent oxidoreductase [Rhodococcus sp. KBS0724]TSD48262.1 LLM class flavin-dependent oxidoreductase [Rhodococcus sp. KBS0724]